jgi:nucleotide-binding universal stress UspA family protein
VDRIVVGIDGSENSLTALRWAVEEARAHGASLEVLTTWEVTPATTIPAFGVNEPATEVLEELGRGLQQTLLDEGLGADSGLDVHASVHQGHAARVLLDAGEQADLVVVGSRGRGGFTGLVLGSVSQHVVSHASCPVVVVPQPR